LGLAGTDQSQEACLGGVPVYHEAVVTSTRIGQDDGFSLSPDKRDQSGLSSAEQILDFPVSSVVTGHSDQLGSSFLGAPDKTDQSGLSSAEQILGFPVSSVVTRPSSQLGSSFLGAAPDTLLQLGQTVAETGEGKISRRRVQERWFYEPRGSAVESDKVDPPLSKRISKPPQRLTHTRLGMMVSSGSSSCASDGSLPVFSGSSLVWSFCELWLTESGRV
jgi:hypothetical protein